MSLSTEDVKTLEKEVRQRKRIASEWAGQMHDLAEERLPAGYEEIHKIAQSTYDACKAWKVAADRLEAAQQESIPQS